MWPYLLVSISGVAKRTSSQSAEIQEFGSEEKCNTSRVSTNTAEIFRIRSKFQFPRSMISDALFCHACYSVAGMLAS